MSFTFISVYMAATAIFFAALVAKNPIERLRTIRSGYIAAGLFAATLGILGYFNVAGLSAHFTLYDGTRVSGPFKDPNVFGPFLVPPIVWLCQDLLLKRGARAPAHRRAACADGVRRAAQLFARRLGRDNRIRRPNGRR